MCKIIYYLLFSIYPIFVYFDWIKIKTNLIFYIFYSFFNLNYVRVEPTHVKMEFDPSFKYNIIKNQFFVLHKTNFSDKTHKLKSKCRKNFNFF